MITKSVWLERCLLVAFLCCVSMQLAAQDTAPSTAKVDESQSKPSRLRAKSPKMVSLRGTISWETDTQLDRGAIVNVWLQEVAPLSVVANIVARQVIKRPGEKPIAFRLKYDPKKIQKDGKYYLLVKIYEDDRTRFVNVARYPVINEGCADQCEVIVDQMN